MMSPLTVTIIGSLNCDMTTFTHRIPGPGETLTANRFTTSSGGKGANQALAAHRLSRTNPQIAGNPPKDQNDVQVCMIGAVGDDTLRHLTIATLEHDGVDVSGVRVARGETTGVAVILVEETSGENRILLTPGANHSLRPEDFRAPENLTTSQSLHQKPDLLVLQLEIPLDTVTKVIKTAVREKIDVLLNTAPAPATLPREVYEGVTHLILNETEAVILSSSSSSGHGPKDAGKFDRVSEWRAVTDHFLEQGVRNVVITLGAKGAYFSDALGAGSHVAAEAAVTVTDTTGAGDTFVGAYAVEVVRQKRKGEWDIGRAVRWACRAATQAVERRGAQEAIPWGDELGAS